MVDLLAPFRSLAQRLTREPRYPDEPRVPHTSRTLAGVNITADNAATVPAVWGCRKYISESLAVMPWHVHRKVPAGSELATTHPVDWLLSVEPNPEWSAFQFVETLSGWALLWGNGYAEIERDLLGRPIALWPVQPWRVDVCRDPDTGRLFYEVDNGIGSKVEIDAADMFHVRGFGDGVVGVNVAVYAAQTIGWAKAAQLFGASFFGNGANLTGVVINKKGMKPEGLRRQKEEFRRLYYGVRGDRTAFLDNDADFKPIGIDPDKAQFIQTHQYLVAEICRWFGVPPHIVAELSRSTNNNIEHQGIEAVQRCLTPWVRRFELEANRKLFGQNRRGYYTKMNMAALLRGDFKSQAEGFQIYRNLGVVNADEVREKLDLNKLPAGEGGDKYIVQGQYTTLDRIGEEPPAMPDDETEEDRALAALLRAEVEVERVRV